MPTVSRRDCLRKTIEKNMNDAIRRRIVPGRFEGVLPDGITLGQLILDHIKKTEIENTLNQTCAEMKADNLNPEFHTELDRCLGLDNPTNPRRPRWYDDRLPLNKPLIDREDLRAGLYQMLEADPENPRVMTVRGVAPGKTYCRWLIQHVADELDLESPVHIDLLEVESVNRFAMRLVDKLGLSYADFQVRFSTEVREGKYFNDWLSGESRRFGRGKRWLMVFDHIAKNGVPQDVSNTVIDLAIRAIKRELINVWVILLDCPSTDALGEDDLPFEEEIKPIPKDMIIDFVDWLVELRRAAGDADASVPRNVQDMIEEPFPLGKPEMKKLRQRIVLWMRERP
jgi:hypothetical protein